MSFIHCKNSGHRLLLDDLLVTATYTNRWTRGASAHFFFHLVHLILIQPGIRTNYKMRVFQMHPALPVFAPALILFLLLLCLWRPVYTKHSRWDKAVAGKVSKWCSAEWPSSLHFSKAWVQSQEDVQGSDGLKEICWKVIMELLPSDTKNKLSTPALIDQMFNGFDYHLMNKICLPVSQPVLKHVVHN